MRYSDFQARVPLQTHPRLAGAIDRMARGEGGVLWPGRCVLFAQTSGTTTGERRLLPMTEELLQHHRSSGRAALLYYTARTRHVSVFRGRHLLLGGAATLAPIAGAAPGVATGELSGLMPLSFPPWVDRHLYEPGATAVGAPAWDDRLTAIIARVSARDLTLVAGLPAWVLELAERTLHTCAGQGRRLVHLQQLWPNLECVVHTGTPVAPFAPQLRAALGPSIKFHEVYAATEAFVATQDSEASQGLRLMTDGGVFFEFLPMSELDNERAAELGPKAVPLAGVKPGVDYALLLTTPGGLARYLLGDVVRFVSTAPPRLVFVGGTLARLNAYGENVTEREVTQALVSVCDKYQWAIVNFHLSVLAASTLTGQQRGRHEWWLELKPGTTATPTGPQIAGEVDAELQRSNPGYASRRKSGVIDSPIVRLVMPGVFEHWLRFQGKWGGQSKIPRCLPTRRIADPLAKLTNFARD